MFRSKLAYWQSFAKGLAGLAVFGVTALTVESQIATIAWVEGESMQPTLNPVVTRHYKCINNVVFLRRLHDMSTIRRGDIISLISPNDPNEMLIKRVIALEGDAIKCRKKCKTVRISRGHCWIEGDNEEKSHDSNDYGQVPLGLIQCKAIYIIWPLSKLGPLDRKHDSGRLQKLISTRQKILAAEKQETEGKTNVEKDNNCTKYPELDSEVVSV